MAQGQRRNEGISQIVQDLQQQSWLAVEAQLQLLANRLIIMKAAHDQLEISKTTQQMHKYATTYSCIPTFNPFDQRLLSTKYRIDQYCTYPGCTLYQC